MMQQSIFSYVWFWFLIVGVLLILLAALLHLGLKEDTTWVWWIFVAGAALALLGIIFAIVSYFNSPRCIVAEPTSTEEFGCDNLYESKESFIPISQSAELNSPVYSPIGTPSRSTLNIQQTQRGFTTTGSELSSLAPPNLK